MQNCAISPVNSLAFLNLTYTEHSLVKCCGISKSKSIHLMIYLNISSKVRYALLTLMRSLDFVNGTKALKLQ